MVPFIGYFCSFIFVQRSDSCYEKHLHIPRDFLSAYFFPFCNSTPLLVKQIV